MGGQPTDWDRDEGAKRRFCPPRLCSEPTSWATLCALDKIVIGDDCRKSAPMYRPNPLSRRSKRVVACLVNSNHRRPASCSIFARSVSCGLSQASIRSAGRISGVRSWISPAGPLASVVMMVAVHNHLSGSSSALAGSARVREILFAAVAEVARHRCASHRSAAASSKPVGAGPRSRFSSGRASIRSARAELGRGNERPSSTPRAATRPSLSVRWPERPPRRAGNFVTEREPAPGPRPRRTGVRRGLRG
jgi:hypothetical protein